MLRGFLKFSDTTSWLAETLAVLLLYGFCLLMLAEVVSRGFLSSSLALSWEYSAFAMAGVFLLGAGPALRRGSHVRVTMVQGMLGPRGQRTLNIAATFIGIVLAVLLLATFWSLFVNSWTRGLRQSSYTNTPLIYPQALAVLGAAQFVLDLCARAVRLCLDLAPEQPLAKEPADA
jgi:TRAP-type C4-dicarboxylate transport system permease small subunit